MCDKRILTGTDGGIDSLVKVNAAGFSGDAVGKMSSTRPAFVIPQSVFAMGKIAILASSCILAPGNRVFCYVPSRRQDFGPLWLLG
jgi:hypothetical protein